MKKKRRERKEEARERGREIHKNGESPMEWQRIKSDKTKIEKEREREGETERERERGGETGIDFWIGRRSRNKGEEYNGYHCHHMRY